MRFLIIPLLLLGTAFAEDKEPDPYADLPPLQAAIELMLSERESPEALDSAIKDALMQGAGEQAALEARFLFHVDRGEDDSLAKLAPEFLARRDKFKLSESEIFGVNEDWLAVVEYVQAIAALKQSDHAAFKKHITEAFWLSPRQGVAFAPHIERLRLDEAMEKLRIDFSKSYTSMKGDKLTLSSIIEGKKALILHFWSPWSRECEASIGDFITSANELIKNDIAVVSVIEEVSPEVISDTEAIFSEVSTTPPGVWIHDPDKASLSQQLRIQNVPMMVLIGLDGKVMFNGHPSEKHLWERLQSISPKIKRPSADNNN
ncbi:TlpA family protein disulfide reductase [Haloferula sp.]|uniref:TlpA family protein disulfide reductase n=1 Tax=Haloferula sp. TaxID=2497595 RepID=UPI00329F95FA